MSENRQVQPNIMEPFKTDFTQLSPETDTGQPISSVGHGHSFSTLTAKQADSERQMTENKIEYKDQSVKDECTPGHPDFGKGVPENRIPLTRQLDRLEKAVTLQELKGNRELLGIRDDKGNFHSLTHDREGQLAGALHNGWRLIFKQKHDPPPLDANGNLDWSKVTVIEIQEIFDYHSKKQP